MKREQPSLTGQHEPLMTDLFAQTEALAHDSSTNALIRHCRRLRKDSP